MPDEPLPTQPIPEPSASNSTHEPLSSPSSTPIANFNIGDEFGTAKRNLPPAGIVLISIAIIAVIIAVIAFRERPKPQGGGSIHFVTGVEVPGQTPAMTLAAITFTLRNTADKTLWVRSLKAQLTGADGRTYEDEAASAVDIDRYYQLFPSLKESSEPPLPPETKLAPGAEKAGTILVTFPITKEGFDQRKSLTVTIQPYDQPVPVVLK
ncbi:MAG: hypothetical protein WBS24_17080 [Terriglobales bacterium]